MVPPPRLSRWLWLLAAWGLSAGYAYAALDRGWVPHDEGQFGQTAERVSQGEIPHRDFDEPYTGGLTYLHAATFRWIGEHAGAFRIPLFAHFLLTLPVVFYLASRWYGPLGAAGITALSTVWTLPNYPAPVPSWYNLFFALAGIGAVVRFLETDRQRWLVVAGVCGGLSFLVKLVGLYYVAGVLLFLLFHEQAGRQTAPAPATSGPRWYRVMVMFLAALPIAGLLVAMTSAGLNASSFGFALLPGLAVTGLVLWREIRHQGAPAHGRLGRHLRLLAPFTAGVALPVGGYVLWFWAHDGVASLWHGLFVAPQQRLANAAFALPPLLSLVFAPAGVLVLTLFLRRQLWQATRLRVMLGLLLTAWLLLAVSSDGLYRAGWLSVMQFLPLSVLAATVAIGLDGRLSSDVRAQQVFLVASVTAFCSLTVVPYSAPVYFCYVFPLMALSLAGVSWLREGRAHPVTTQLLVFFLAFGVLLVNGVVPATAREASLVGLTSELAAPRARGIRVHADDAAVYDGVLSLIATHRQGGSIYAFPDSPEVYYLSHSRNPGRTIYEFLADPPVTDEQHLSYASEAGVRVVVINMRPGYSGVPAPALLDELARRFPAAEQVGRFLVRWRP